MNSGALGIAKGPDGNLWYIEPLAYSIVRLTPSGTGTEFLNPTPASTPELITAGPDGNLWYTESHYDHVQTSCLQAHLPVFLTTGAQPYGIAAGPDGNVWFAEIHGNRIGRVTPAGVVTEYPVPTTGSYPFYITGGPDGAIWSTDTRPTRSGA